MERRRRRAECWVTVITRFRAPSGATQAPRRTTLTSRVRLTVVKAPPDQKKLGWGTPLVGWANRLHSILGWATRRQPRGVDFADLRTSLSACITWSNCSQLASRISQQTLGANLAGGNSHQRALLSKMQRASSRDAESALPKPVQKASLTTGTFLTLAGTLTGIVGWFVGFTEFPLTVHLVACGLGLCAALVAVWYWEYQSNLWKSIVSIFVVLLYAAFLFVPIDREYNREINGHFRFKDSSQLSWSRKLLLIHEFSGFEHYLGSLGIDIPPAIMTITVIDGAEWRGVSRMTSPGLEAPAPEVTVGADLVTNRRTVMLPYSNFLLGQPDVLVGDTMLLMPTKDKPMGAVESGLGLSCYFVHSYLDESPLTTEPVLCKLLLDVREKFGSRFSDKLAAAAIKALASDQPIAHTDTKLSAVRMIMIGDSVVEPQCDHWSNLRDIIVNAGLATPVPTSGMYLPLALEYSSPLVSTDCLFKFVQNPI